MNAPRFPSDPAVHERPRPRKREGAPGKGRQLKESAERQDTTLLRERAARGKGTVNGNGVGSDA